MPISIRPILKTDSPKAFRDFICELIDEDTYLLVNKKPTMKEERIWLKDKIDGITLLLVIIAETITNHPQLVYS